ncbi:DUF4145 domain-containing protein [Patescibacteria group bacterium]
MKYSKTLSLDCPYCKTKTQFISDLSKSSFCGAENLYHDLFTCTNCGGCIVTKWKNLSILIKNLSSFRSRQGHDSELKEYYPMVGDFIPRMEKNKIKNELVKKDYIEAIDCYNNGFYNASMVMARRTIHQELDFQGIKNGNLYKKINSLNISKNLKELLQKVKNFGNTGAHPDFFLYDKEGSQLISEEKEKEFAKLSLIFLDRYFQDQHEMDSLINSAPNSKKETEETKNNKTKENK